MRFNIYKCVARNCHHSSKFLKEKHGLKRLEPVLMSYNIYNSNKENNDTLTPLVIMHGLFGSKSNWNSLSKALSNQTGRKVISVDARNHGESPHSDEFSYYHLVEDVNYLLKSMNISQACILGHSMGGRVMMLYAHVYPESVDKLIVVDISHKSPGSQMTGMSIYFDAMKKVNLNKELSMPEGRRQANDQLSLFIQLLKERWKNIRAVFVRHMKSTQEWLRALGKPFGNLSQPLSEEEEGPALGDGGNDDDDLLSETPLPSPSSPPPSSKSSSQTSSTLPKHQDHQSEPIKQRIPNKKKRTAKYDNVEYLDRKKASSSAKSEQLTADPREEALKMFLLSFLPDLTKMDDGKGRQFKKKRLDAVDDIRSARSRSTHPPSSSCLSLSNDVF